AATTITNPLAHTLDIAMSNGVSGITRRWSMVPCSRSRTMAAPASMIASMVMLLMIAMTLMNHAVLILGLNAIRTARLTGDGEISPLRDIKSLISFVMIC